MKNFIYSGDSLTFTHDEDAPLLPGQGYFLKNIFGIVSTQLRPDPLTGALSPLLRKGQSGELFVVGVYELPMDESKAKVGQTLYWEGNKKCVTAIPEKNRLIGIAAETVPEKTGRIKIRLLGVPTQENDAL
jgi:predicted RecA/RadA family phage recombinase